MGGGQQIFQKKERKMNFRQGIGILKSDDEVVLGGGEGTGFLRKSMKNNVKFIVRSFDKSDVKIALICSKFIT